MSDDLFDDPDLFAVTPAPAPAPTVFERLAEAGKTASSGDLATTQIVLDSAIHGNGSSMDAKTLPPRRARPKPAALQETPSPVHIPDAGKKVDDGPVAAFACFCGFRDEVRKPAPDRLNCPECKAIDGLVRWVPRYPPPVHSARELTDKEVARLT